MVSGFKFSNQWFLCKRGFICESFLLFNWYTIILHCIKWTDTITTFCFICINKLWAISQNSVMNYLRWKHDVFYKTMHHVENLTRGCLKINTFEMHGGTIIEELSYNPNKLWNTIYIGFKVTWNQKSEKRFCCFGLFLALRWPVNLLEEQSSWLVSLLGLHRQDCLYDHSQYYQHCVYDWRTNPPFEEVIQGLRSTLESNVSLLPKIFVVPFVPLLFGPERCKD